jgi:hypothetical protein
VRTGSSRRYFATVRGDSRIPSFNLNSLAMRSSPHVEFSAAISRINRRRPLAMRGRPLGFDFQRQNSRNSLRCHRMNVSGFTFTSASRQGNMRLRVAIIHRVESTARPGLTFRSWKSASCLRRKRFSAASVLGERATREARRTKSNPIKDNVRKQYATAPKTDGHDMNAQDCTLQRDMLPKHDFDSDEVLVEDRPNCT